MLKYINYIKKRFNNQYYVSDGHEEVVKYREIQLKEIPKRKH
jgi:hypothetical protein